MKNIPISGQLAISRKTASIDARYGPYNSKAEVMEELGPNKMDVLAEGITVGIRDSETNEIVEYWFKGGTTINHLVKKIQDDDLIWL